MYKYLSLAVLLAVVSGCGLHEDHKNRVHPIIEEIIVVEDPGIPGDMNGDGIVDEVDLDILKDLLEIQDPDLPDAGDCNSDGFVTLADVMCIFDRLCEENNCEQRKCRRIFPRPHRDCYRDYDEEDDDDDDYDH